MAKSSDFDHHHDGFDYEIAGWYDTNGARHDGSSVDWDNADRTVVHFHNSETGMDVHFTIAGPWDDLVDWEEWIDEWIEDRDREGYF